MFTLAKVAIFDTKSSSGTLALALLAAHWIDSGFRASVGPPNLRQTEPRLSRFS
jgi:hypothetical protein